MTKAPFLALLVSGLLWFGVALAEVNINNASRDQLDGLKGIDPNKAQAIIDYRRKNGPFNSVDELQKVPGIGPATLKDIRRDLTVSGASRAPAALPAPSKRRAPAAMQAAAPAAVAAPARPSARPAAPAMPGPAVPGMSNRAASPARPASPTMPGRTLSDHQPAAPAKPAAPAMPAATSSARPAPASPARPAMPARPATVN